MKTNLLAGLIIFLLCQTGAAGKNYSLNNSNYLDYPAMQAFIDKMAQKGFDYNNLVQIFSHIQRDEKILQSAASPAEKKQWKYYRPIFLNETRIKAGMVFWDLHQQALQAAEKHYGIPPEYIVAIIGIETLYGRNTGKHNVLRSLTTLAMDFPKRSTFYISELEHYFQLIREERLMNPLILHGSYAGAMGLGQFISSSYRKFAIDFNGDGKKDLWNPEDAIGSIANYFQHHGWQADMDVSIPARLSRPIDSTLISRETNKPKLTLSQLSQQGIQPLDKFNSAHVGLLELFGANGVEYWITGDNFYTITRYNHSPKYAMAVFQLAQKIKKRKQLQQIILTNPKKIKGDKENE